MDSAGRLTWCSNLMLVVLAVSGVSLISRLDARDWQRDLDLLTLVERTNGHFRPETFRSARVEAYLAKVAELSNPENRRAFESTRKKVIDWLVAERVLSAERAAALRDVGVAATGPGPTVCLAYFAFDGEQLLLVEATPHGEDLVSFHIERHRIAIGLADAKIATGVPGPLPSIDARRLPPLNRVYMDDRGIVVRFGKDTDVPRREVVVKADTTVLERQPASIGAPEIDNKNMTGIWRMLESHGMACYTEETERQLHDAYGNMTMNVAKEVASEGLLAAYGRISIFGFEFSTKRFPLVVGVGMFALSIAVLSLVGRAKRNEATLDASMDRVSVGLLVGSPRGRFLVWVLAPAASVAVALPYALIGRMELIAAGTLGGVATLIGLVAFLRSRRL